MRTIRRQDFPLIAARYPVSVYSSHNRFLPRFARQYSDFIRNFYAIDCNLKILFNLKSQNNSCCMRKLAFRMLTLCVAAFAFTSAFAQRNLSGIVTDENRTPLAGATVSVKGADAVTTTDATGKFTINVPADKNILVVSYVGMKMKEFTIGKSAT